MNQITDNINTAEERILELEKIMLGMPQAESPVRHIFGPGLYIREVFIPKGAWAIGHFQKTAHMNIMISGSVEMYLPDGSTKILTAPMTFMAEPGRKIGHILEDTLWQNVYPTTETDVEVLESTYLNKSQTFLDFKDIQDQLAYESNQDSRDDFKLLALELGVTEQEIQDQAYNQDDLIDLPPAFYKFQKSKSAIEGFGLHAVSFIYSGEIIGPGRLNKCRTDLGRYLNHSVTPNAIVVAEGDDLWIRAIQDINGQRGGLVGDEITIDYRQAHQLNKQIEQETKLKELLCQV